MTRFSAPTLSTVIRHAARTRTYTTGDATLPAGTMTSRLREVWHRAAGLRGVSPKCGTTHAAMVGFAL